jgi:ABC-2 type transport system permease protein
MRLIVRMTALETKLFLREPGTLLIVVLLPTVILVALGIVLAPNRPEPSLGGQRFVDLFVPSMVVITLAVLGVNTMPARLVRYRQKGFLRRLSTTPIGPVTVLVAQLLVNVAIAVVGLVVLMIVGYVAFGIPMPRQPIDFAAAFLLGMTALLALGLLIAAVSATSGVAAALIVPLFVTVMFLGGVYVPRPYLPDVVQRVGDFMPPGVQALQDAWLGTADLSLPPLAVMAAITVLAGGAAARRFRWD